MKKIILILFLLVSINKVKAIDTFRIGDKVPDMYIEQYTDTDFHNGAPYVLLRNDGKAVYCINPYKTLGTGIYEKYIYNDFVFNLTDEQINKINLLSYYGYNYKNHTDLKWYGITQFLIWKTLLPNEIYFTDVYKGKPVVKYTDEINEIILLVEKYYLLPSFNNKNYNYTINSEYKLDDLNNVIDGYEIYDTDIDAEIKDNSLYINTVKEGTYKINFIRKDRLDENYVLYYGYDSQSLIYPGKFSPSKFSITIEVKSGSITINKANDDNDYSKSIYALYDKNHELITEIETNELGIGYIDNLMYDKYYIKEISTSLKYELDSKEYEIDLNDSNKDIIINSYEPKIQSNLIINKYYETIDRVEKEDGAVFEIYDKDNNFINSYSTTDGVINVKLEYGEYKVIQKSCIEGYNLVDSFNVTVKSSKDNIYNLYSKKIIEKFDKSNISIEKYNEDIIINKNINKKIPNANIEDEVLNVYVPNTNKDSIKLKLSIILIITGIITLLFSKIKTTNY